MQSTIKLAAITVAVAFLFSSTSFAAPKEHADTSQGAAHMSTEGAANTNSVNSGDQDKGMDRAKERMSNEAATHKKAHEHMGKKKGEDKAKKETSTD